MQHHMKHMVGCVAVVGVVVIMASTGGGAPSWAPLLLVLACPLMMISMMYGMSHQGQGHDETDGADEDVGHDTPVG